MDRYLLLGLIGEGGMGCVYRALDNRTGAEVAVKESRLDGFPAEQGPDSLSAADERTIPHDNGSGHARHEGMTRERAISMFQSEAKLLGQLRHDNLPRVTDFFATTDGIYLVMELVDGIDLSRQLEGRDGNPFTEAEVVEWALQVMKALDYCHRKMVIHRDVKPSNIIVKDGRAWLVDFGIAKMMGGGATTVAAVTSGYSAPESYSRRMPASPRSDIYALGATMYTLLSGRIPPDAGELSSGAADLEPPPERIPGLSSATAAVIRKAMSIKVDERFSSISEMQAVVSERYISQSKPVFPEPRPTRVGTRGTLMFAGVGAIAVMLAFFVLRAAGSGSGPASLITATPDARVVIADVPSPATIRPSVTATGLPVQTILTATSAVSQQLPRLAGSPETPTAVPPPATVTREPPTRTPTAIPRLAPSPTQLPPTASPTFPLPRPSVSNVRSCIEPCLASGSNSRQVFPERITTVNVAWEFANFQYGARYQRIWTVDGLEFVRYDCAWDASSSGTDSVKLTTPIGLKSGRWEMLIAVDGEVIVRYLIAIEGTWPNSETVGIINACHGLR